VSAESPKLVGPRLNDGSVEGYSGYCADFLGRHKAGAALLIAAVGAVPLAQAAETITQESH
jgi:hypothetical protein